MKSRILSVEQLKVAGACQDGIDRFLDLFPSGSVEVSVEAAKKVAGKLAFNWAGRNFLSQEGQKKFKAAIDPHVDTYNAAFKPLYEEYWADRKPLDNAYRAARKSLDDAYEAAKAETFAEIYIEDACNL